MKSEIMHIDDEINAEYKKIENEKKNNEILLESNKNKFAEKILGTNLGDELRNCNLYTTQSRYKLKLPLRKRIGNFFNKLKIVFGYGVE